MSVNRVQATPISRKYEDTPMWGIAMCILVVLPKWVIGTTAIMWVLFAIMENLLRWSADKSASVQRVVNGILMGFLAIDMAFNALVGSIWFLERPKGAPRWYIETFSDRLRRHYLHERTWRYHLAALFRGPINHISGGHI